MSSSRIPHIITILICACSDGARAQQDTPGAALDRMLPLPAESIDIAEAALTVARGARPDLDVSAGLAQLEQLASTVQPEIEAADNGAARLGVLAEFLYGEQGYGRRDVLPPDVYVGLDEVLAQRQWNCLGLSVLYLAMGERLGLPLRMVSGPGHVFVQYDDGADIFYVETTEHGKVYPTMDYLDGKLPFPCLRLSDYRVLTEHETIAVILGQTGLALQARRGSDIATPYYRLALRFNPRDAEAQGGIGFALEAAGRSEEAVHALREAVQWAPNDLELRGGLANLELKLGQIEAAERGFEAILARCPREARAMYALARLRHRQQRFQDSVDLYTRYVSLVPADADGHFGLAFALEDLGDIAGAIEAYRRSIAIQPDQIAARINVGLLLERSGRLGAAADTYRSAIQRAPEDAEAHALFGAVLVKQGYFDGALRSLERALQLNPKDAEAHADRGQALQGKGKMADALAAFEQAALLAPENADVLGAYANALEESGDVSGARAIRVRIEALNLTGVMLEG